MKMLKKVRNFIVAKKWLVIILLALVLVGGFGMRARAKKAQKENGGELVEVERGDIEKAYVLSGEIDAHEKAALRFQAGGRLAWVGVKEGDWVKKYQALASLDKRQLQKALEKEMYDYASERHDFEQGEDDYEHTDKWFELSDEVKRILDKNQNDLSKAVLDVELADLAVRFATLTTPIEGLVTFVETPFAGVNITPATADFEVVNPGSVYFLAEADEEEVVSLIESMGAIIYLDAYDGEKFAGEIKRVSFSPVSAGTSPTYKVEIDFVDYDNAGMGLRLGMEGEVEIVLDSASDVLFIPFEALRGSSEDWVYVMEGEEKVKREIKKGLETDDEVEILSGLSEGEQVLVD